MIGWNDVLRFLLELGALVAVGYWGFTTGSGAWAWILGLGAPLAVVVFWGLLVAPKARFPQSPRARALLGLVVFALATAALLDAGSTVLGIVFGALAALNAAVMLARGETASGRGP
jgi:hypothetical protein